MVRVTPGVHQGNGVSPQNLWFCANKNPPTQGIQSKLHMLNMDAGICPKKNNHEYDSTKAHSLHVPSSKLVTLLPSHYTLPDPYVNRTTKEPTYSQAISFDPLSADPWGRRPAGSLGSLTISPHLYFLFYLPFCPHIMRILVSPSPPPLARLPGPPHPRLSPNPPPGHQQIKSIPNMEAVHSSLLLPHCSLVPPPHLPPLPASLAHPPQASPPPPLVTSQIRTNC